MNKQTLKLIKATHSLSYNDIAVMCGVSVDTVKAWLYRKGVNVPENMIRLLNFELTVKYDKSIKG